MKVFRRSAVGLADLAYVVRTFGPISNDMKPKVIELLNLTTKVNKLASSPDESNYEKKYSPRTIESYQNEPFLSSPTTPQPSESPSLPPSSAQLPYRLVRLPPVESHPPRSLTSLSVLLGPSDPPPLQDIKLFPKKYERAILTSLTMSPEPFGEIILELIVSVLSEGRAFVHLPRKPILSLNRGLQLLLDFGKGMIPFYADLEDLLSSVRRIVGYRGITAFHFDEDPTYVGMGPQCNWHSYHPPPPGTPVLAATDLGIAARDPMVWERWLRFARELRNRNCQLRILIPYPPERWPQNLLPYMTPVFWDRTTRSGEIHRNIGSDL